MSTIEDKLLDGPRVYYCDAGDDDIRPREDRDSDDDQKQIEGHSVFVRPKDDNEDQVRRSSRQRQPVCNTGPKGVMEDFRQQSKLKEDDLEAEFEEFLKDDSIIKVIAEKRLAEEQSLPVFGHVLKLQTGAELLREIDEEHPRVLILAHIYTKHSRSCAKVDKCLKKLSEEMKHVKIVTLDASVAGLSDNFKEKGVPALLAYRDTKLIKSLVQLDDYLDRDFDHTNIKELLKDNDIIH